MSGPYQDGPLEVVTGISFGLKPSFDITVTISGTAIVPLDSPSLFVDTMPPPSGSVSPGNGIKITKHTEETTTEDFTLAKYPGSHDPFVPEAYYPPSSFTTYTVEGGGSGACYDSPPNPFPGPFYGNDDPQFQGWLTSGETCVRTLASFAGKDVVPHTTNSPGTQKQDVTRTQSFTLTVKPPKGAKVGGNGQPPFVTSFSVSTEHTDEKQSSAGISPLENSSAFSAAQNTGVTSFHFTVKLETDKDGRQTLTVTYEA